MTSDEPGTRVMAGTAQPSGVVELPPVDAADGTGTGTEHVGALIAGRYRIGTLIGSGGTADVYRAVDVRDGGEVAVKLFREPEAAEDRERFESEARALATLDHPRLVTFHDSGTRGGRPYLVMSLVDGGTLAARLREGALPEAEVRRVARCLAEALSYVHSRGLVHRDVKPGNVLLDRAGDAYLADFGVARLADTARLTATGCLVGTASYVAPEQVRGGPIGPRTDVYALGLVLLECFTGRREYQGPPLEAAFARLDRTPHVPAHLPLVWRRLLTQATATRPVNRPDAGELLELLDEPAPTLPAGRGAVRFHRRPVRVRGARRYAVAAAACAAVAGTAAVLAPHGGGAPADRVGTVSLGGARGATVVSPAADRQAAPAAPAARRPVAPAPGGPSAGHRPAHADAGPPAHQGPDHHGPHRKGHARDRGDHHG